MPCFQATLAEQRSRVSNYDVVCVCVVNCDLRVRSEAEVLVLYDEGVQKLYSFLPVDIICGLSALKIIKK
jgi:hypothetical protein